MKLILRLVLAAVALYAAQYFINGVDVTSGGVTGNQYVTYLLLAIVLSLVMGLVKPILTLLTCPLQIITLGLFSLVVNALAFWAASIVAQWLDMGFTVQGFWPALWGSLVYSIISAIGAALIEETE